MVTEAGVTAEGIVSVDAVQLVAEPVSTGKKTMDRKVEPCSTTRRRSRSSGVWRSSRPQA
ncbi:hypothetical protein AB0F46_40205 [Streptomyces sp. NPDC026665]|uniref:hypothetical protein n=1 Tax=Streptomyces sp. NPDC026665 TaxID=3154798 RepID=UPI0033F90DA4